MSDQLQKDVQNDIQSWAEDKLDQWASDVITRCEIADIDPRQILAFNAITMAAKTVALGTSMPISDAATLFGKSVERIRDAVRRAQSA